MERIGHSRIIVPWVIRNSQETGEIGLESGVVFFFGRHGSMPEGNAENSSTQ
jgi:hypothetical protein